MLDVQNISCFRGCQEFFFDLSFDVELGDAWVITGQNGAGKSTLLTALIGLFPLSGGDVLWNGEPLADHLVEFHRQSLLLGHKLSLKGRETPVEHLQRWAAYQKCNPDNIPQILERWGIENPHRQLRTYSAGQQKRVALSRLLLEPKKLWLLDEPLSHLDTRGKEIFAELVAEHRQTGGSVIATTHEAVSWPNIKTLDLDQNTPQIQAA